MKTKAIPRQRYVVDERGKKLGVFLDLKEYERLLEALEDAASTKAYDAAKVAAGVSIPYDDAIAEIKRRRR